MDLEKAEKIVEPGKKNIVKTCVKILIIVAIVAIIAWVKGFFGERGKQDASPPKERPDVSIEQRTEGDQSPAIISPDVNLSYGSSQEKTNKD